MGGNFLGCKYISLGVSHCTNLLKMSCIFRRLFQRNHFHFLFGAFPFLSLFTTYLSWKKIFPKVEEVMHCKHPQYISFFSFLLPKYFQHEYLFYRCWRHCQSCSGWSEFLSTVCNGKITIRREINSTNLYLFQDLCLFFYFAFLSDISTRIDNVFSRPGQLNR